MRRLPASLLVAYALVGAFFAVGALLRKGEEARASESSPADDGTTRLIVASFGAALVGVPLLALPRRGRLAVPAFAGPAIMVLGLGLRAWAALVLGRFYTRTLRITREHALVTGGPYRLVRNPGYLGTIAVWIGFGLSSASWLATLTVTALMAYTYGRRIRSEEAMLLESLGDEYRAYMSTTWRLVPGVY